MPYAMVKCGQCPAMIRGNGKTGLCAACLFPDASGRTGSGVGPAPPVEAPELVAADRAKAKSAAELTVLKAKYAEALTTIAGLEAQQESVMSLKAAGVEPLLIEPRYGTGTGEGTVVVPASDWHIEERVDPGTVNGLNRFDLEIAQERVTTFFQASMRLTKLLQQDIKIDNMVMPLLGDFISGDIHEEIAEVCQVPPMEAAVLVQNWIAGGIEMILDHTKLKLVLPCHSGNHGRTTKTTRFGMENGHSLEYLMYKHLEAYFRTEKRVRFDIATGPHSYMNIYGTEMRFQHGHMVKYGGGVGGIYIPVNKAIAQWNKGRHADLDIFGHFHQQVDGNDFLCNGSLIGYNSFALSIKAPFDRPKQTLFLMDKRRGRTCTWPILFNR